MSKALVALSALGALTCAGGIGAGIWGAVEADKEYKRIPEIREAIKQDYENGNIDLNQYTVKMEELARDDANLPVAEGLMITFSAVAAIGAGVFTWGVVEFKDF